VGLLYLALAACSGGPEVEVPIAQVERSEFRVTLDIPGELKATESMSISVPDLRRQAKVKWIVDEGTRVEEGDLMVTFDDTELATELVSSQTSWEIATTKNKQKRAQLKVRLKDLENAVVKSNLSLERAEMKITESETVPRVDRESARIDVKQAELAVAGAAAALESARLEGEAELHLLRLEATREQAKVDAARRRLDNTQLYAPAAGLVIKPRIWKGGSRGPVVAGDSVWSGANIIELPDLSEMEVQAWVHEVDAGKVAQDMTVLIIIDAFPEPARQGTVTRVADLAIERDRNSDVKHLEVTIKLAETDQVMKPGMTVRSEVLVETIPDVLSVPLEAIFGDAEGVDTVQIKEGPAWRRQEVTLGTSNDTHVVIETGLLEGQWVALIPPDQGDLKPGPAKSVSATGTAVAGEP
jgi:multidrug efflux pump subunit AcrA (membrane-fusion protein)